MSKLVMIIDDSATVRKIVEVSLKREGIDSIGYANGLDALRDVTTHKINRIPDLLILDLDLPKMSGYEVARYLRSKPQWSKTIIVILSKHDGILDRLKARLSGAQAYLTKPFTRQTIVDIVNNCLKSVSTSSEIMYR